MPDKKMTEYSVSLPDDAAATVQIVVKDGSRNYSFEVGGSRVDLATRPYSVRTDDEALGDENANNDAHRATKGNREARDVA